MGRKAAAPTAEPEPEEEDDTEPDEQEEEPTAETNVLRAEWLTDLETRQAQLENRINESLTGLEGRVMEALTKLSPAPLLQPKVDDPPKVEPEPTVRPLLGFLTKAPRR